MSHTFKHSRNHHGDPVLTITVIGWHDIFRLQWNLLHAQGTCDACAHHKHLVASYPEPDSEPWLCAECAAQADYEASWHPAVARAVADLLVDLAVDHEDCVLDGTTADDAIAVARAYLGRADA